MNPAATAKTKSPRTAGRPKLRAPRTKQCNFRLPIKLAAQLKRYAARNFTSEGVYLAILIRNYGPLIKL